MLKVATNIAFGLLASVAMACPDFTGTFTEKSDGTGSSIKIVQTGCQSMTFQEEWDWAGSHHTLSGAYEFDGIVRGLALGNGFYGKFKFEGNVLVEELLVVHVESDGTLKAVYTKGDWTIDTKGNMIKKSKLYDDSGNNTHTESSVLYRRP